MLIFFLGYLWTPSKLKIPSRKKNFTAVHLDILRPPPPPPPPSPLYHTTNRLRMSQVFGVTFGLPFCMHNFLGCFFVRLFLLHWTIIFALLTLHGSMPNVQLTVGFPLTKRGESGSDRMLIQDVVGCGYHWHGLEFYTPQNIQCGNL